MANPEVGWNKSFSEFNPDKGPKYMISFNKHTFKGIWLEGYVLNAKSKRKNYARVVC